MVSASALALQPWSKGDGSPVEELRKKVRGHMQNARIKFTTFGREGALKLAEQLEKDRKEGYECCVGF
eukprot:2791064-Karenia_brevis.AAC.1